MILRDLFRDAGVVECLGSDALAVGELRYRSSDIRPGDVFCTWQGEKSDGHRFVMDAVERGASAVVVEKEVEVPSAVSRVRVSSGRRALAVMAANYYGRPASQLKMVGITGTNGKTSTAFLMHYLLGRAGMVPGLIGTVEYRIGSRRIEASRTTPEGADLQAFFREMLDAGCDSAVMEVSSHALSLERVAGIPFAVAVFTNLTQDHLDYHKSMENYFLAKQKLFTGLDRGAVAVVNADDAHGLRVLRELPEEVRGCSFAFDVEADFKGRNPVFTDHGTSFECHYQGASYAISIPWVGAFNASNALAAFAAVVSMGLPPEDVRTWMSQAPAVPGRLEKVGADLGLGYSVVVDYAHTDDAVRNILGSLKPLTRGRLKVLIGCGGDRDRAKRPLMARAACELGDEVWFTSDNPRSEDPKGILDEMVAGVPDCKNFRVILKREEAIASIIGSAQAGDLVVLAGKGHETYQEINGEKFPFNDAEIAIENMTRRGA